MWLDPGEVVGDTFDMVREPKDAWPSYSARMQEVWLDK
jgi:hypothetical protein